MVIIPKSIFINHLAGRLERLNGVEKYFYRLNVAFILCKQKHEQPNIQFIKHNRIL